jgi:outer membrane lipoprotein LolB
MWSRIAKSALALLVLSLAACSHTPLMMPDVGFSASGKVNIRQTNQSDTAQFVWQSSRAQDQLTLSTPFGTTLAELVLSYQGEQVSSAVLNRGDSLTQADDPDALLYQLTGLALPVSGLRWWLLGQPMPNAPFERDGTILLQAGWRITASDYREGLRPYRIELSREDLTVRVIINEWKDSRP